MVAWLRHSGRYSRADRTWEGPLERARTHLILGYLGSLACLRVFGLWKTTLNLGFLCFFHVLFFTCFAAFCAFALAGSLPPWAAEQTHTSVHGDVSLSTSAGMRVLCFLLGRSFCRMHFFAKCLVSN